MTFVYPFHKTSWPLVILGWCSAVSLVQLGKSTVVAQQETTNNQTMQQTHFGQFTDGRQVKLFTLQSSQGLTATISDYGGIVVSLSVPDRTGKSEDIVLGYDNLAAYVQDSPYFGCITGRYANRIAEGKFRLDGHEYQLAVNQGPNHLHGGKRGFDKVLWSAEDISDAEGHALKLTYLSPDKDEGYPGNLSVTTIYRVPRNENELRIRYRATADRPTPVNLTHHSYFNLGGSQAGDILAQELMIVGEQFLPVDRTLIPTGELRSVQETPFDFRNSTRIGKRIDANDDQLRFGQGYDHCWVLTRFGTGLELAARLFDEKSGRVMEVLTTEPGIQLYSGNALDGSYKGKKGRVYGRRSALCLETQHYPDSPNHPDFPSTILRPGEVYESETVYRFSTAEAKTNQGPIPKSG
jgi:aldose 1-epimerase